MDSPTVFSLSRNVSHKSHQLRLTGTSLSELESQGEQAEICVAQKDTGTARSARATRHESPGQGDGATLPAASTLHGGIYTPLPSGTEASADSQSTDNQVYSLGNDGSQDLVLDQHFLQSCRFYSHDPRKPSPTSLDLLFKLGNHFGVGVTKPELRQILRKCKRCRNYMYTDTRVFHACGTVTALDVTNPAFHMVTAFLATVPHRGFSQDDILYLLRECRGCHRICLNRSVSFHACATLN